ncbi:MAG TPA: P-loop NTPase fold protein [Candidatus Tectomicrobia bacterium]
MSTLLPLWKGVRAFGVNPASLMATMSGGASLRALKAQAGFRYQFAAEFQEVTRALNPYSMVILIDDLDRCRPENVLEVLETVNFLVSSGDCFVIMGMALDRVERCVGLHCKDVAEELLDDNAPPIELAAEQPADTVADEGRKKRAEFARQYLEKLINIEVPVPIPTADESRGLIVSQESKVQDNGPRLVLPRWARPQEALMAQDQQRSLLLTSASAGHRLCSCLAGWGCYLLWAYGAYRYRQTRLSKTPPNSLPPCVSGTL